MYLPVVYLCDLSETSPLMGEERIQLHMQRKAAAEADAASLESWQELREVGTSNC